MTEIIRKMIEINLSQNMYYYNYSRLSTVWKSALYKCIITILLLLPRLFTLRLEEESGWMCN